MNQVARDALEEISAALARKKRLHAEQTGSGGGGGSDPFGPNNPFGPGGSGGSVLRSR